VTPPKTDLSAIFERFEAADRANTLINRFDYLQWRSAVALEQETIRHRYAQVNATILARVWTRLMGFTTGMVLAIVGAAFILGKLREPQTELKHETEALKVSLATSSPGIVLAVLGTFLMSITLLTRFDIGVRDIPTYVAARPPTAATLPDPARLVFAATARYFALYLQEQGKLFNTYRQLREFSASDDFTGKAEDVVRIVERTAGVPMDQLNSQFRIWLGRQHNALSNVPASGGPLDKYLPPAPRR
jgi:hypothetical protein